MRTKLYINGEWVDGIGTVAVHDPSDGSVIAEVSIAGDGECEAALAAADAAAVSWAKTTPRFRSEILRKAFEIMTAENEAIATLISYPLHGINFAVAIVNPKNLPNCSNHCNYGCGINVP